MNPQRSEAGLRFVTDVVCHSLRYVNLTPRKGTAGEYAGGPSREMYNAKS